MEERLKTENAAEEITENGNVMTGIFAALKRFWALILAALIIGIGVGVVFAKLKDKPVYVATKDIMFTTNVNKLDGSATGSQNGSSTSNNVTLAKKYLPDLAVYIVSDLFVKNADKTYKAVYGEDDGSISGGAISVDYSEKSLIFSLSYSDASETAAKRKLDKIIESANTLIQNADNEGSEIKGLIMGEDVKLKSTQTYATVLETSRTARIIVIAGFLGLLVGVMIAVLITLLDNTVKNRYELERLTGGSVIAYIEDVKM